MTSINEVRKLIESGFDDLELIAFELDIPIEQVKQCKVDVEASKQKNTLQKPLGARNVGRTEVKKINTINTGFNEENYKAHVKMDRIRDRFNELVYGNKKQGTEGTNQYEKANKKSKELSSKEIELIERTYMSIDEKIQEIQLSGNNRVKKSELAREIIALFKKIDGYELSVGLAEKLYVLMNKKELDRLKPGYVDQIDDAIRIVRKKTTTKLAKALEARLDECKNIEELLALSKMITEKMSRESQIFVGGLKSSISNKIMQLQQQQTIDRMKNDIPMNIASVIRDLVSGKINMQSANGIIDEEARKKVQNSPKTKFALSEDAQRRQVLMQIKTVLVEKATTYAVQVPETVIRQLQELCGIGQEEAIRIVVRNCISRKDYKTARSVCDTNDIKNEYGYTVKNIASLRDEILHAEFADVVLEGMSIAKTYQDEKAYIDMIQKAIDAGKIRATGVKLGKSVDGLRNVTLADIWDDERTKHFKNR